MIISNEDLGKATEAELDFIASCCDSLYTELKMQAYTEAQEQAVDKHILDDLVQSVLAIAEPYYKKR